MNRRIVLLVLLLFAALVPGAASAQNTPEQRIAAAREQARAAGIPVQLLDTKVAEGRAKNVPPDRVATAVERRLQSLTRARDALGRVQRGGPSAQELSVAADAVEVGVSAEMIVTLARETPPAQRAVALAVLTQLVRDGRSPGDALQAVRAAVARGPEALRNLPGESPEAGHRPPGGQRDDAASHDPPTDGAKHPPDPAAGIRRKAEPRRDNVQS